MDQRQLRMTHASPKALLDCAFEHTAAAFSGGLAGNVLRCGRLCIRLATWSLPGIEVKIFVCSTQFYRHSALTFPSGTSLSESS